MKKVNQLNITDKVKLNMPNYPDADKATVEVCNIDFINNDIYYNAKLHVNCPDGNGEGYDTTVQFKDGQYEILQHTSNGPDYYPEKEDEEKAVEKNLEEQENISELEQ